GSTSCEGFDVEVTVIKAVGEILALGRFTPRQAAGRIRARHAIYTVFLRGLRFIKDSTAAVLAWDTSATDSIGSRYTTMLIVSARIMIRKRARHRLRVR